jgi:ATP-dependent DNA helicase DinG
VDEFIKNFPFPNLREKQSFILNEIENAFASDYKYILLEAPTGFGKSPVAVGVALALRSSHFCTSSTELQMQYATDFPFLYPAIGMDNFQCLAKEDLIRNQIYQCRSCENGDTLNCSHKNVDYGLCHTNGSFKHYGEICGCLKRKVIEHMGCKYRIFPAEYVISNIGTKDEEVCIDPAVLSRRQQLYDSWSFITDNKFTKSREGGWAPCTYYHQVNMAFRASHSLFNYSNLLIFLKRGVLPNKELLVLDEGHLIETEMLKQIEISISRSRFRRYIPSLKIECDDGVVDYDISKWFKFLQRLEIRLMDIARNPTQEQLENQEFMLDISRNIERISEAVKPIEVNIESWIIADIEFKGSEVVKIVFKPLDVSPYCSKLFDNCKRTLIMSATILNKEAYCRSVGLNVKDVKFIQVDSDFPVENRPIFQTNTVYLKYDNLGLQQTHNKITLDVDKIMTKHNEHKGIIHTTSYQQRNFIRDNMSDQNRARLIVTDPRLERTDVIENHISSEKPTVLLSPSLFLGIDLKDDLSRFQIITKVPFPYIGDRWTAEKLKQNPEWYYWQTAWKLIQAYGRSIRSMEDWAKTYVLDSAFGYFVKKNRNILPDWFVRAIKPISSIY